MVANNRAYSPIFSNEIVYANIIDVIKTSFGFLEWKRTPPKFLWERDIALGGMPWAIKNIYLRTPIGEKMAELLAKSSGNTKEEILASVISPSGYTANDIYSVLTKEQLLSSDKKLYEYAPLRSWPSLSKKLAEHDIINLFGSTEDKAFFRMNSNATFRKITDNLNISNNWETVDLTDWWREERLKELLSEEKFDHKEDYKVIKLDHTHSSSGRAKVDAKWNVHIKTDSEETWRKTMTLDVFLKSEVDERKEKLSCLIVEDFLHMDQELCPSLGYYIDSDWSIYFDKECWGALNQSFDKITWHFAWVSTIEDSTLQDEWQPVIEAMKEISNDVLSAQLKDLKTQGLSFEWPWVLDFALLEATEHNSKKLQGKAVKKINFRWKEYYVYCSENNPRRSWGSLARKTYTSFRASWYEWPLEIKDAKFKIPEINVWPYTDKRNFNLTEEIAWIIMDEWLNHILGPQQWKKQWWVTGFSVTGEKHGSAEFNCVISWDSSEKVAEIYAKLNTIIEEKLTLHLLRKSS